MNKTLKNTFQLNIGPQHPSTHGVLRCIEELDGERIKSLDFVVGYLHRGMEKMAENMTCLQYLPVVDRVDYLSGFFCSQAYLSAIETSLNFELPKKAQYIRVLTMELNRISSHLLWLASFLMDLGATSPYFYCFRERESILDIFENITGARMMYNYYTFGGVKSDISAEILDKIAEFLDEFPSHVKEYENIITNNPIFLDRTKEIGVISLKQAQNFGLTGVNLRASGSKADLRKDKPYLIYSELDFDVPFSIYGDAYTRYQMRIREMLESRKIALQCIEWLRKNISDDKVNLNINSKTVKIDEGLTIGSVEAPRGEIMCWLWGNGTNTPERVKWRTPSFYALQVLPEIMKGKMYSDLMSAFGSLDVIMPEVDR
ncbi:NADH-quinone oxidoreductase subunit D [bacterium]|nr:NADH-quinone oxidoreductase subunit D [bacterium]